MARKRRSFLFAHLSAFLSLYGKIESETPEESGSATEVQMRS